MIVIVKEKAINVSKNTIFDETSFYVVRNSSYYLLLDSDI